MNEQREPSGLARQYHAMLTEEGFRPGIDDDGDVVFKFQGLTFFIDIHERDTQMCSIVLPRFWSIDDDDELRRALQAANDVNGHFRAAKVFVRAEDTSACVDLLVQSMDQAKAVLIRALQGAFEAAAAFRARMHALSDTAVDGSGDERD